MARRTRAEAVKKLVEDVIENPKATMEDLTGAAIRLGLSMALDKPDSLGVTRLANLVDAGGRALSAKRTDDGVENSDEAYQKWLVSGVKVQKPPTKRARKN